MSGKRKSMGNKISLIGLCIAAIGYGIGMHIQPETGATLIWIGGLVGFSGILRVWFDIFFGAKE